MSAVELIMGLAAGFAIGWLIGEWIKAKGWVR